MRGSATLRKLLLVGRVWTHYARVSYALRRHSLPDLVRSLDRLPARGRSRQHPATYARAIHLGLRLGPWAPRCLPKALIMFRLLREQGDNPQLVIGIPERATTHIAHAWIELEGKDVGPPPGRGGRGVLAQYP